MLSLKFPRPRLHFLHNHPLKVNVWWSWSHTHGETVLVTCCTVEFNSSAEHPHISQQWLSSGGGAVFSSIDENNTTTTTNDDISPAMKLFKRTEETVASNNNGEDMYNITGDPTTHPSSSLSIFEGYTNPNTLQVTSLSDTLFSRSTGIDSTNIRRLIDKSRMTSSSTNNNKSGGNKNNDIQQWDIRKRLEQKEEELGTLRTALHDLVTNKDIFVTEAIKVEKELRLKLREVQSVYYDTVLTERKMLHDQLTNEKENNDKLVQSVKVVTNERDELQSKYKVLSSNLVQSTNEIDTLQQTISENTSSMTLLQTKLDECTEQRDKAMEQITLLESSHTKSIQQIELKVRNEMNVQLSKLQNQNDILQNEMKLKARETFELCNHFNIPTSSINFTDMTCNNSFLNTMKCYHDGLQLKVQSAKDELECCRGELTKVTADYQVSGRE